MRESFCGSFFFFLPCLVQVSVCLPVFHLGECLPTECVTSNLSVTHMIRLTQLVLLDQSHALPQQVEKTILISFSSLISLLYIIDQIVLKCIGRQEVLRKRNVEVDDV